MGKRSRKKRRKKSKKRAVRSKKSKSKRNKFKKFKRKKTTTKKKRKQRFKKRKKKFQKSSSRQIIKTDSDGNTIIKVSDSWSNQALVNRSKYQKKYSISIKDNEKFWKKEGKRITWIKPYTKIKDIKYSKEDVKIKWFYDGTLNASANCIDRHLKKNGNKTAIIWVGDDPSESKKYHLKNCIKMFAKQQMV